MQNQQGLRQVCAPNKTTPLLLHDLHAVATVQTVNIIVFRGRHAPRTEQRGSCTIASLVLRMLPCYCSRPRHICLGAGAERVIRGFCVSCRPCSGSSPTRGGHPPSSQPWGTSSSSVRPPSLDRRPSSHPHHRSSGSSSSSSPHLCSLDPHSGSSNLHPRSSSSSSLRLRSTSLRPHSSSTVLWLWQRSSTRRPRSSACSSSGNR
jgi:hypothetical protein